MPREKGEKVVATNRKARHDYLIEDTYEAGIVLSGTEVKSLREGKASLVDGYAYIDGGEMWLRDAGHAPGDRVRVRVLARDVSIARVKPQATSIQNLLCCTVQEVLPGAHPSQDTVRLACGASTLLARITARAADAYGQIVAERESTGRPIGVLDAQIAAIARVHRAAVATRNVADFQGCGVVIVNPYPGSSSR